MSILKLGYKAISEIERHNFKKIVDEYYDKYKATNNLEDERMFKEIRFKYESTFEVLYKRR